MKHLSKRIQQALHQNEFGNFGVLSCFHAW
jgi:hypothetical protein